MAATPVRVLAINAGSSSIKFAVYQSVPQLTSSLHGQLDRIGLDGTTPLDDEERIPPSGASTGHQATRVRGCQLTGSRPRMFSDPPSRRPPARSRLGARRARTDLLHAVHGTGTAADIAKKLQPAIELIVRGSKKGAYAMQGLGMSAVTAYTAHREWATRPPDERYASIEALQQAARARRDRTTERGIETGDFRTEAAGTDGLTICEASGRTAELTHWSFEQLATIAGAPPNTCVHCPHRSRRTRSTSGFGVIVARNTSCSPTVTPRGQCTRSHHRVMRASTMTSWPPGCWTSWPHTPRGPCRSPRGRGNGD